MADKAFPSVNDLGGGKTITEANARNWLQGLMTTLGGFIVSGLTVPASDADLTIAVAAGVAYIDGYRLEKDGANVTVGASTTTYIYLTYAIDGSSNVLSLSFTTNTTGITAARSVMLCSCISSGSAITSTRDRRKVGFAVNQGYSLQVPVKSTTVSLTSVANTANLSYTGAGILHAVGFKFNSPAGAGLACDVLIDIDGAGGLATPLYAGGNPQTEFLVLAVPGQQGARFDLQLPFRVFVAVTFRVTGAGSGGTCDVVSYYSKAL